MKFLCNKKVPMVPRGNNFTLIVELQQIVVSDNGEEITTQIEGAVGNVNIYPSNGEPVGWNDWQMAQTSNGDAVAISIPATQPLGPYGIEITGTRTGGGAFRWFSKPGDGFIIVDASADGYLTDMVRIYTITGVVGVGLSVGGGGSAEVGSLDTTSRTALTPNEAESFGENIKLHWVAKTGSYDDLNDKPEIPAAQVQPDWNATEGMAAILNKPEIPAAQVQPDWNATEGMAAILNKPEIPNITGLASEEWVRHQGFLTQHQDISGKEDKITIATSLASNSTAEFDRYYLLSVSAPTTINLPAVSSNATKLRGFLIYLTVNTGGDIDFMPNNSETIMESGLSSITEGKTYEVNAVWNGLVWAITVNELTVFSTSNS